MSRTVRIHIVAKIVCVCVCARVCVHVSTQLLSCVQLFMAPWTLAYQAPLSLEFSSLEYWSSLPFPPPGDLPDTGIESMCLASPALAGRFFTTVPSGKPSGHYA